MKRRFQYYFILILSALLAALWLSPEPVLSKDKKKRERAFLGVSVQEVVKKYRKKYDLKRGEGVLVAYVQEDSPADYADLERHDIILEFDGARLKSPRHLNRLVRKRKPGDKVTLFIIHDGKKKKVQVELTEPEEDETEDFRFFGGPGVFSIHLSNRPYLGVYLQQLNQDLARYFKVDEDTGVLITEVEEDSPAADVGIKPGDILTKIDREEVQSVEDAEDILSDYEPDDEVEITVIRSGREKKFKVELDEAKSDIKANWFSRTPVKNRVRWEFPGWGGLHGLERLFERRGGDSDDEIEKEMEILLKNEKDFPIIIKEKLRDRERLIREIEEKKDHIRGKLFQMKKGRKGSPRIVNTNRGKTGANVAFAI